MTTGPEKGACNLLGLILCLLCLCGFVTERTANMVQMLHNKVSSIQKSAGTHECQWDSIKSFSLPFPGEGCVFTPRPSPPGPSALSSFQSMPDSQRSFSFTVIIKKGSKETSAAENPSAIHFSVKKKYIHIYAGRQYLKTTSRIKKTQSFTEDKLTQNQTSQLAYSILWWEKNPKWLLYRTFILFKVHILRFGSS